MIKQTLWFHNRIGAADRFDITNCVVNVLIYEYDITKQIKTESQILIKTLKYKEEIFLTALRLDNLYCNFDLISINLNKYY